MSPGRVRRWTAVCIAVLAAHVALVLCRIPGKVYGKRADEIARYRAEGAAHFAFSSAGFSGAEVIEWLCAHVPRDHVVLWRGETKGPFEVLAGLIAPRLLVAQEVVPADATCYPIQGATPGATRPLAHGTLPDGRSGVLVVEAHAEGLALHVR